MDEYAVEDIRIDPADMNLAFKRGLKGSGVNYLEELRKMASNDYELEGEEESLARCFDLLKKYVLSGRKHIGEFELSDLETFGLSPDVVSRIGYLAFQHDTVSPLSSLVKKQPAFVSRQSTEDYDDDFEVEDDPEMRVHSEDLSSSDELYIGKSSAKDAKRSSNRYESKHSGIAHATSNDGDDIEEETFDLNRNARPMENHTPPPKQNVTRLHPRISPEVNYVPQSQYTRPNGAHAGSSEPYQANVSPPKPAVVASAAFLPVQRPQATPTRSGLSKSTVTTSPTASAENAAVVAAAIANRASTASGAGTKSRSGNRVSRSSQNGRIRTAAWIESRAWRLGEKIGSGAFGEVFQGLNDKGTLFAVKRMNMANQPQEIDNLLGEIQLMRGLSHPHIVEYLGAWVDTVEGNLYIFQEWVPGGSVAHLLKQFGPFSLGVVREYTRQILLGLEYLHENGIIHRDIKGGNILVDANRTVKLADFGASTQLSQFNQTQVTTTVKGTPYFMAPEVLASSKYGRKGDIWAVGCTMIQMLTGEPPWKDRNLKGLVQLHLLLTSWEGGPPPYNCEITEEARECLELCFQKKEADRPTASQLLQCRFLSEDDDLDDSIHTRDPLEDSGVLSGLKQDMARAVNRSGALGGLERMDSEDTIVKIDKQLAERAQKKPVHNGPLPGQYRPPASTNPYGYQNLRPQRGNQSATESPASSNLPSGAAPGSPAARWEAELPQGQFADSPARYSQPVHGGGLMGQLQQQQPPGSASGGSSSAPTPCLRPPNIAVAMPMLGASPSSNNPFARGATSVRKSSIAMSPASGRTEGDINNEVSPAEIITPRLASDNNPFRSRGGPLSAASTSPSTATGTGVLPSPASQEMVRDSLQVLKKRTSSAGPRRPGAASSGTRHAGSNSRPGSGSGADGNISTNRDSEQLTPYPQDASDSEDDFGPPRRLAADHTPANRMVHPTSVHPAPMGYANSYDIADEEAEVHVLAPMQKQDSLASIEEEALALDGYLDQDEEEQYVPSGSRNNSGDSRDPYYARRVTPQSGRGDGGMYTRPKTQSRDAPPPLTMMKSSSDFGRSDVALASRIPRREVSTAHSGSHPHSQPHYMAMASSNSGGGAIERRIKPYPVEKKSASASARRAAPLPAVDTAHRPFTSKASFGGGGGGAAAVASHAGSGAAGNGAAGSRNNSASSHTSHASRGGSAGSAHGHDRSHAHDYDYPSVDDDADELWLCLKCGAENPGSSPHCEHCATVRGADGRRGANAAIRRIQQHPN